MNTERLILAIGFTERNIKTVLQELADEYEDSGFTKDIVLYKSTVSKNTFVINFPNEPDFERFKYFVNYIFCPQKSQQRAKVFGYWTVSKDDDLLGLNDKRLMLYVSETDVQCECVHGIFEGDQHAFKFGFELGDEPEKLYTKEIDFIEPQLTPKDFKAVSTLSPEPLKKSDTEIIPLTDYWFLNPVALSRYMFWALYRTEEDYFKSFLLIHIIQYPVIKSILILITYYGIFNFKEYKFDLIFLGLLVVFNLTVTVEKKVDTNLKWWQLVLIVAALFILLFTTSTLIYP